MSRPHAPFMSPPHKRMRDYSLKALLIAALSLGFAGSSLAENAYWTKMGSAPVYMQQVNNGAKQTLKFLDYKDDMLLLEMDLGDGNVGQMSMPVSETMARTLRFDLDEMQQAHNLIRQEKYSDVITLLRPKVYPLIKFHKVPELLTQLHYPIRTLLDSLISNGDLDEADDLIARLALDNIDLKYSDIAIRLMHAYLEEGNNDAAARIARDLPKSGAYAANITQVVRAADALRGAGEYEAVIPLYREIEDSVPEDVRKNVRMWLAYSLVLADRVDEATPMIDAMAEPAATDRLFSLYKLLQGSRDHRNKDYRSALDVLTRGFVRAQTSYIWVPEMLFLIGDCYAQSEDLVAARNVWSEITVLYPDSPWAERAAESLGKLPEPQSDTPAN
jgi:tetratricopeptide (TPR) repeat protein